MLKVSSLLSLLNDWEELIRFECEEFPGYLYDDFSSEHDYELVANYARDLRVVLLELPRQKRLIVTGEGHAQVR